MTHPLDVDAIRAQFPALDGGTAYFDGPGGSQTPTVVADAIRDAMVRPLSNRGKNTAAERNADEIVVQCRLAIGELLNAGPDEVIFGRSMTALTFDLSRTLSAQWRPGDEIVVTRLDHDANVRPWVLAAARAGAVVRWVDFDSATSELPVENVEAALSDRTRLVAITAASNLIGTIPDVETISAHTRAAGALLYVDGVHYTAHSAVDFHELGADFFACSPYKFLGPHCGVVVGRHDVLAELRPDKLLPAPDRVPERFELGTLPYELMAGTTAAVDFLAGMTGATGSRRERLLAAMTALEHHEDALRLRIEAGLRQLPHGDRPLPRCAPDADVARDLCRARVRGDQYRARTARHQCACRFVLRLRGVAAARAARGWRCAHRPGALQHRRRRRPSHRRAGDDLGRASVTDAPKERALSCFGLVTTDH